MCIRDRVPSVQLSSSPWGACATPTHLLRLRSRVVLDAVRVGKRAAKPCRQLLQSLGSDRRRRRSCSARRVVTAFAQREQAMRRPDGGVQHNVAVLSTTVPRHRSACSLVVTERGAVTSGRAEQYGERQMWARAERVERGRALKGTPRARVVARVHEVEAAVVMQLEVGRRERERGRQRHVRPLACLGGAVLITLRLGLRCELSRAVGNVVAAARELRHMRRDEEHHEHPPHAARDGVACVAHPGRMAQQPAHRRPQYGARALKARASARILKLRRERDGERDERVVAMHGLARRALGGVVANHDRILDTQRRLVQRKALGHQRQ
eukprot:3559548-Prymnesium_polylepis.2